MRYVTASHVWLEVYGKAYNEDGADCTEYITAPATVMKLIRKSLLLKKRSLWNEEYDKSQNSKLQKAIKYYFSKLE